MRRTVAPFLFALTFILTACTPPAPTGSAPVAQSGPAASLRTPLAVVKHMMPFMRAWLVTA